MKLWVIALCLLCGACAGMKKKDVPPPLSILETDPHIGQVFKQILINQRTISENQQTIMEHMDEVCKPRPF